VKAMKELRDSIDCFISFFHEQIQSIASIQLSKPGDCLLFKKILYVSMIDSLSKAVSPQLGNRSRERFVGFFKSFIKWKYSEKISLPHLKAVLENTSHPDYSKLKTFANSQSAKWVEGEIIELDKDPDYMDVFDLWPKDGNGKPKSINICRRNITLNLLTHGSLFYAYRNTLVHEMRKPGYGLDWETKKEPYYAIMDHLEKEGKLSRSWELVYPVGFLEDICESVLEVLEKYYKNNKIDPYAFFNFGTYWIEELNASGD